jgi:hypothetical protein
MSKIQSDWVKEITKPVFQKNDLHKFENYRNVSLLCAAHKMYYK